MTDSKQKRLQSLDQDVLSVPSVSTGQTAGATRQVRGDGSDTRGQNITSSGRSTGGTLMLLMLTIIMLVALAVSTTVLVNMQQRIDSLQIQISELKEAADKVSLEAKTSFLEGQLMLLDERLDKLEKEPPVVAAESSNRSDGLSQGALREVNARVRKLDIESSHLQKNVDDLTGKLTTLQTRTQQVEALASSQSDVLARHPSPQDQQKSELDKGGQLEEINGQLEQLNNDVRSIYRMLEMGR